MKLSALLLVLGLCASSPAAGAQPLSHGHHAAPRYVSSRCWTFPSTGWVRRTVWVPARCERVWVEPVYGLRIGSCGQRFRVLVRAGHWTTIERPGHYETRRERVHSGF
jgi:hypothetical protein